MASLTVVGVLRTYRQQIVSRLTGRIQERIPQYSLIDPAELRKNIDSLFDDFLAVVEDGAMEGMNERLAAIAARRIQQGFAPADYLRAINLAIPVLRTAIRDGGPSDDPAFGRAFATLEDSLHDMAASAANLYVETIARQLKSKNDELQRLNETLRASERALSVEAKHALDELQRAGEFNRRIIETLSSGLMVIESQEWSITHFSTRMEEILGIPSEEALGRNFRDVLGRLEGFDADPLVTMFRSLDYLPLTKLRLKLPSGKLRTVFVRARRMKGRDGENLASVLIVDDVSEKELLLDSFSRYVSRDLLQRLLARNEPLALTGERRTCTVLFADIRGFTGLAEKLPPEQLHTLLNEYFRVMIEAVAGYGGFIDKFVGDMVMALFIEGEPAEAATAALRAARRIKKNLLAQGDARVDAGIGINTGEVLLGNVGTEERMDFTAIGDAVNVASRLQSLARTGEVLVGEATAKLVGTKFQFRDKGELELRGRTAPLRVFELSLDDEPSVG